MSKRNHKLAKIVFFVWVGLFMTTSIVIRVWSLSRGIIGLYTLQTPPDIFEIIFFAFLAFISVPLLLVSNVLGKKAQLKWVKIVTLALLGFHAVGLLLFCIQLMCTLI